MNVIEVKNSKHSYVFSPYREPVAYVSQGDRVIIYTNDCFENRIKCVDDLPNKALASTKFLNPLNGPIYIKGSEPGDTLSVRIENIEPMRDFAVSCFINYFGGLTSTSPKISAIRIINHSWSTRFKNNHR